MKIKQFKFKQILKLHLLNSGMYEYTTKKVNSATSTDSSLIQVVSSFKKALSIIFEFHQAKKTILFIGVPKKLELKINKLTNHTAVPHSFDLQGVISNTFKPLKLSKKDKNFFSKLYLKSLLPKLLRKPDLVVLFSHEKKQTVINESYIAKVPLITFDCDNSIKDTWVNNLYNVQGVNFNVSQNSNKNIFFIGLNFLFRTSNEKSKKSNFNGS
uniref:Ribosomal protein S2 n=1 Tax=Nitzschia sp. NIES-3576 TaxID=2083273 RepID=A0A2Z5ZAL3_9STRA|nr:ribosomal protein S2 [Nitzschia sp. NIES-3576]